MPTGRGGRPGFGTTGPGTAPDGGRQFHLVCPAYRRRWSWSCPWGLVHDARVNVRTRSRLGPSGTYFITADIRPLGERDGIAFCRALPERAGVVAVPTAVFYDHRETGAPFVRFAFCKQTSVLEEAARRLKGAAGPRRPSA